MPKPKKIKFKANVFTILLGLILIFAAILRFYNLNERMALGQDSTRDAFVAWSGAQQLQLPLSGAFTSVAPIVSTPWYWIQLIVMQLLLKTLYAPWILTGTYSWLTVLVMYAVGVIVKDKRLGLILAIITALSPQLISDAIGLNNHAVISFFSSLSLLLYLWLLKNGPRRLTGFLFGISLGLAITAHYQAIGLLTLPLTLLWYRKKYLQTLLFTGYALFIIFLPLIIFELNNHWFNIRHLIQYLRFDQYKIWVPKRWLTYIIDYWPTYLTQAIGGTRIFTSIVMAGIAMYFLVKTLRKKLTLPYLFLGISFAIQVIMIRYYRGELFYGYLKFLHPYIFLFTGLVLYTLMRIFKATWWGVIIVTVYIWLVLPQSLERVKPDGTTLDVIKLTTLIQQKLGPGPYQLYKCKTANRDEIEGLAVALTLQGKYDRNGKKIGYFWGCKYPRLLINEKVVDPNLLTDAEQEKLYPSINWAIKDFSEATEGAIVENNWYALTPDMAYHKAARWWMDEQP